MSLTRVSYTTLLSIVVLLILGGCKRHKPLPHPIPLQPVDVITLQPQKVIIHTNLPGRTNAIEIALVLFKNASLLKVQMLSQGNNSIKLIHHVTKQPTNLPKENYFKQKH